MHLLPKNPNRRAVRRAARTRCQAVGLDGFRLLGEQALDLSPRGMLVACDTAVELGERVIVSFKAPGQDGPWMDAEAELSRIVQGYRPEDPGYCVGLDFLYFERSSRQELLVRLAGTPPPIPGRRLRDPRERVADAPPSVLVRGIIAVTGRPRLVPYGAFYACYA
ncbi:MAG: hypothetical protein FD160_4019 [Caulobacteraceae bacterium]|nr:MAG: hypothetical protein FD160_4019 [Caulobacteraceae bacterium]